MHLISLNLEHLVNEYDAGHQHDETLAMSTRD